MAGTEYRVADGYYYCGSEVAGWLGGGGGGEGEGGPVGVVFGQAGGDGGVFKGVWRGRDKRVKGILGDRVFFGLGGFDVVVSFSFSFFFFFKTKIVRRVFGVTVRFLKSLMAWLVITMAILPSKNNKLGRISWFQPSSDSRDMFIDETLSVDTYPCLHLCRSRYHPLCYHS